MKIGGKLKEEFLDNETRYFSYLLDMATTVKWQELLRNDFNSSVPKRVHLGRRFYTPSVPAFIAAKHTEPVFWAITPL